MQPLYPEEIKALVEEARYCIDETRLSVETVRDALERVTDALQSEHEARLKFMRWCGEWHEALMRSAEIMGVPHTGSPSEIVAAFAALKAGGE